MNDRSISELVNYRRCTMANPLTLSVWLGITLYVAVGLFAVIIFHDAAPIMLDATSGYGISSQKAATPKGGHTRLTGAVDLSVPN
jgi:hypothetical protein